jgi:flagellar protein FlbD
MIQLTRINHKPLVLNSDLIEHLEVTPDTVISLNGGQKFVVLETADEVIEKVIEFRGRICRAALACTFSTARPDRLNPDPSDSDH